MDVNFIANLLLQIQNSNQSIQFITAFDKEMQKNNILHPSIEYQIGVILWKNGKHNEAIEKIKSIITNEINNNFQNYDTIFSDSIGMSASFLIKNIYYNNMTDFSYYELFKLGYYYLSNHIKLFGYTMYDSLRERAIISDDNDRLIQTLVNNMTNSISSNPLPQILSDYYFASKGYSSNGLKEIASETLDRGKELYQFLSDMRISGKSGNEYTFLEMAELGKERTNKMSLSFKILDINTSEVEELIRR